MGANTAPAVQEWSFAVFALAVFGIAFIMLAVSWLLGGRSHGQARNEPFESGVVSVGGGHMRFSAKFYLVAMFFVIFDLESVFLYAWAISARDDGWAGLVEAGVFILVLLGGLVYIWRLRGLDWGPASRNVYRKQGRRGLEDLPH